MCVSIFLVRRVDLPRTHMKPTKHPMSSAPKVLSNAGILGKAAKASEAPALGTDEFIAGNERLDAWRDVRKVVRRHRNRKVLLYRQRKAEQHPRHAQRSMCNEHNENRRRIPTPDGSHGDGELHSECANAFGARNLTVSAELRPLDGRSGVARRTPRSSGPVTKKVITSDVWRAARTSGDIELDLEHGLKIGSDAACGAVHVPM